MDPHRRVVITGIGLATPSGLTRESTWRAVVEGQSAVAAYDAPDAGSLKGVPVAAVFAETPPSEDRFVFLGRKAAAEALADASVRPEGLNCIIGTTKGPIERLCRLHEGRHDVSRGFPFLSSGMDALLGSLGVRGDVLVPVAACATGAYAVIEGARRIRCGMCDVVLAGATDAPLIPLVVGAFHSMGVCADPGDDAKSSVRPFDLQRSGFALGEGAALLVLEDADSAARRGARPYCELAGGSVEEEAHSLMQPEPTGRPLAQCIGNGLHDAGVAADEVDYINAHGTATPANDRIETAALKLAFGSSVASLPVSSTKPVTGHLLAAAGALEVAICALALHDGVIPPTINLTRPDPQCDLDYVSSGPRRKPVRAAVSIAAGFGGHLTAVVLRRT